MLTYIIHKDQNQLTNQTTATTAKQLGLLVFINTRNRKIDPSSQKQKPPEAETNREFKIFSLLVTKYFMYIRWGKSTE